MTALRSLLALAPLSLATLVACGDDATGGGGAGGDGGGATSTGTSSSTGTSASTGTGQGGGEPTGAGGSGASGDPAGTGGAGGGTGGGGTGAGTTAFPDDCATNDDCPDGECISISGFRTCRRAPLEATACTGSDLDACCDSTGCADGERCARLPDVYCGGAPPVEHNACIGAEDECLDCAKLAAACVPGGALGYEIGACVTQACGSDADCEDEDGGRCIPVDDPCCGAVSFQCAYPSDGCRTSADCDDGAYCGVDPEAGRARCAAGVPACPP